MSSSNACVSQHTLTHTHTHTHSWIWAEAGTYFTLEEKLGIGGFGYPALATVNSRKKVYSILRGSFSRPGIEGFVKEVVGGATMTFPVDLPDIETTEEWDGQDGMVWTLTLSTRTHWGHMGLKG